MSSDDATPPRFELRDTCPACGGPWAEVSDRDGRTYYPNLCGNYDRDADRTTSWTCLHCSATWPRGDRAIYKEPGDDETPPDGAVPWVDEDGTEKLIEWREIETTPPDQQATMLQLRDAVIEHAADWFQTPPAEQDIDGPGRRVRVTVELDQQDLAVLASIITDGPDVVPLGSFDQALRRARDGWPWMAVYRILGAVTTADHEVLP